VRARESRGEDRRSAPALPRITLTVLLGFLCSAVSWGTPPRRIAIRVPEGFSLAPEFERLSGWARRAGVEVAVAEEPSPAPAGWEAARVTVLPASESFRRLAAKFPVRLESKQFVFDGRAYGHPDDAIALSDPSRPGETFVIGVGRRGALRLLARRLFYREEDRAGDYLVVSGELSKSGRFARHSPLAIDRSSDRDEIAARERFFRSLKEEERAGIRWRFRDSERAGVARWEPVLRRFLGPGFHSSILVVLFPDAAAKGRDMGSSRPADLSESAGGLRVDLDFSAPPEPDLVSPVLASAAHAARDARLLARPMLLAALGAQSCRRWWGRDVSGFAAFARQARVEPAVAEVLSSDPEVSPVLAVGAAASWIDAGVEKEGETAVLKILAAGGAPLETALKRWAERASSRKSDPPARRPLPPGFLRGISYAMSNSADSSYASPRSRQTLARVAGMSVNSISVMPFAFMRDPGQPSISFIHRNPGGETDEGTVRALSDARDLGMSAMVKPQIWIGGGRFVGEVAMRSEDDWRRFFDAYRRFLVHHAVVAEAAGVSLFCIGTELVGTEGRPGDWRETIAAVRLATGAPLTYASNWAAGAPKVPFWDALDAIGADFYDPLSPGPEASDAALEAGVAAAAAPLERLSRETGKPVVFTEAGYPPVRGAWIAPHDENSGRPPNASDAGRAVAAVFRALEGRSWWKGVYWWKAFSNGAEARPDERGYNVLGTPAEKVIARGFSRLAHEARR
jgi:glycosyl hydrolase family 113